MTRLSLNNPLEEMEVNIDVEVAMHQVQRSQVQWFPVTPAALLELLCQLVKLGTLEVVAVAAAVVVAMVQAQEDQAEHRVSAIGEMLDVRRCGIVNSIQNPVAVAPRQRLRQSKLQLDLLESGYRDVVTTSPCMK